VAEPAHPADQVVVDLIARGLTVATGESLTAGLVAATLAEVPGCSAVLQGGVIAYQREVKSALLGVTAEELSHGVVSQQVAVAMARGAARVTGAQMGIGTTGVAGPDAHEGQPVGTVWVAVSLPERVEARQLHLAGDREAIRRQTVVAVLDLIGQVLAGE
jgi:nicotinamide-nucleotide amidase